jgi:hypothetical protein
MIYQMSSVIVGRLECIQVPVYDSVNGENIEIRRRPITGGLAAQA